MVEISKEVLGTHSQIHLILSLSLSLSLSPSAITLEGFLEAIQCLLRAD